MQSNLQKRFRAIAQLRSLIARLRHDREGVAAVEFAMITPIVFMLFMGCLEYGQALTVDRRTAQAASAAADLVARAPSTGLTTADVDGLLLIANQLMAPYDTQPLTVNVISVIATGPNNALQIAVDWSRDSHGGTPYAHNAAYPSLPANLLLSNGSSVVVGEAKYHYSPFVVHYFVQAAFDMKETFYLKPRNTACVSLLPIDCTTGNPMGK